MEFLTDFADQAVILPAAGAVLLVLLALRWWRGAASWLLCVGGVLGLLGVLKIVFAACTALDGTGIRSPSGHTGSAAVVYGGLLVLAVPPARRGAALAGALGFAALFGGSRLALGVHTPGDVVTGGLVGLAGAALLAAIAGPRPAVRPWPVVAAVAAMVAFHGLHLPAEAALHGWALAGVSLLPAWCRA